MKTAFVLMFSFVAASFAAGLQSEPGQRAGYPLEHRRSEAPRLRDVGSRRAQARLGRAKGRDGERRVRCRDPNRSTRFRPTRRRMMVADEERGFDGDEAVSLHHLLDVLSLYCAESVVWWDEGQGAPAIDEAAQQSAGKAEGGQERPQAGESRPARAEEEAEVQSARNAHGRAGRNSRSARHQTISVAFTRFFLHQSRYSRA